MLEENELIFYELKNKVYHYDYNIDDNIILSKLREKKIEDLNEDKIDVLFFIERFLPQSFGKDFQKLTNFVDNFSNQIFRLSKENNEMGEQQLLKTYIFCFLINENTLNEQQIRDLILQIKTYIDIDIEDQPLSIWYVKEQLRIMLLKLYNLYDNIFKENIEDFSKQLEITKANIENIKEMNQLIWSI